MDEKLLGIKELYSVVLKSTYPIEIDGALIEAGEIIASFDKIQIAGLDELKTRVSARGGFDNRDLISWETTREMPLTFSQGVFSLKHLSLLSNSKLFKLEQDNSEVIITAQENAESDENGEFTIAHVPVGKTFVYNKETGEKLEHIITGTTIRIETPYTDVSVSYSYAYMRGGHIVKVGNRLLNGYLELEARTRLKDDISGRTVTGIFKIPKLKLMSDLSMRLGDLANPMMANFRAVGVPVGNRGNNYICELLSLNDDIDSDM